jgi:hypothetical protein
LRLIELHFSHVQRATTYLVDIAMTSSQAGSAPSLPTSSQLSHDHDTTAARPASQISTKEAQLNNNHDLLLQ